MAALSHIKSNIIADFTGTVTAFNSAGSTITVNATDLVRPSDWNSAHNFYQTISGNTSGQSTASGTNLVFQGGNNVTLSMATGAGAATIVVSAASQSNQTAAVGDIAGTGTTFNGTNASASMTLNSNGLRLDLSAAAGGGGGGAALSAGTQSVSTGTVAFANSNGITFGMSGSSQITASHNGLTSQSNQALSGSNGSLTFQTATFGNLNGLSFYTSNGSMVGSYTVPTQTNQSLGLYASSNTTGQSSSTTVDARSLSVRGMGIASVGYSGGELIVSVPAGGGGGDGYNILAAGTQTATTAGSVVFSNSNGITFGMSGSTRITASHNGLTTARASNDAIGLNTAQSNVTWTVNSSGLSLDARGYAGTGTSATNASVTLNSNGLAISVAAPGGGGGIAAAAGTQTATSGTIVFANSNGLTFGMSGSSQVTASYTVPTQTAQTMGVYATSNTTGQSSSTTYDARSLTIRGYGILSVGNSNGSILLSTPDPVDFTQLSVGMSTGGNTSGNTGLVTGQLVFAGGNNITLSGSTNAGSMTITISGGAGGGGGVGLSAGTQSVSTGTVVFSNSNGITFGMSGSSRITASHNGLTTAAQSDHSHGNPTLALTNLSGTTASNSAGFTLSLSAGAGGGGVTPVASASNGSFSFTTLAFSNANNVTFGTSAGSIITASVAPPGAAAENNAIQLLGANTAGNTTATGSTIGWSGVGVTLSGTNVSQVVISAPATSSIVGVGGISLSTNGSTISVSYTGGVLNNFRAFEKGNNSTYSSLGQNTVQFQHFIPEDQIQVSYAELWARGSFVSSTNSQVYAQTIRYGIYSQGTGANSTQMSLAGSSSLSIQASFNSNTAAGYTIGNDATSITSTSGGTALMTQISGPFHLYMPFSTTLQPNVKHAFAVAVSSATTVGTSPFRFGVMVQTVMNSLSMGRVFVSSVVAPATSVIGDREMGVYTATSGALPATYGTGNISIAVSRQQLPFMLEA